MSRYSSRDELVSSIKQTIRTDYHLTGLPTDPAAYNMTGVLRDLGASGTPGYGWTYNHGARPMAEILRANLRGPFAGVAPARHRAAGLAVETSDEYQGRHALELVGASA